MGEVTIEAMVLTVTPVQSQQGLTMIEMVIGESFKGPVAIPMGIEREMANVTIAVQRSLSQLPGFTQHAGNPRITLRLTEEEYSELGRPRYPDRVVLNVKVNTE
jgi:hypothetical protein